MIMEFEFLNVGPIKEAKINFDKDLTFVYGKNNIGKSYTITLTYLILKNLLSVSPYLFDRYFLNFFHFKNDLFDIKENELLLKKLEDENDWSDITTEIIPFIQEFFSNFIISNLESSIISSYGSIKNLNNKITGKNFKIILHFKNYNIELFEEDNKLKMDFIFDKSILCRKVKRHLLPKTEETKVKMYYIGDQEIFGRDLLHYIVNLFKEGYTEIANSIGNVYFLPASRSGLYRALNAFSQILVELSKKRNFLHQKIVLPSISEQDSDYFSLLNEINTKKINTRYNQIAEKMEDELLKGKVSFDQTSKQILFKPNNSNMSLELLGTSSMIAEISPIVLFIRHIVSQGDERKRFSGKPVIFIEEPEAHLHPENQVKLTEFFANLIKEGSKIIITSHSNYIFSKLNNLIAEKKLLNNEVAGFILENTPEGSVSRIIKQNPFGLEDNNFVNVSETLYEEKIKIINELNNAR